MTQESIPKRSLLQKYDIPIEFLDFPYVNTCTDAKTLEKIVKILRSGEEGYYPDLTRSAEEKLKELKPNSKIFRAEEPILRKEHLNSEKREEIEGEMKAWIDEMRKQDQRVREIIPSARSEPPIRKLSKPTEEGNAEYKTSERIKSTDYSKWEKFDADAAELKVDLDDERQKEIVEVKNKINLAKTKLIEEIGDEEVDCLSDFEKEHLSMKFKEKGNECYKAKEYDEAIKEYTQSLRVMKSAAVFNNRALIYLKQKLFIKVISDTNECLAMEPKNVKALMRKAQAFIGQSMLNEAYDTFEKILDIEGSNQYALTEMAELRIKMPPRNAYRMKIVEINDVESPKKVVGKSEKLDLPTSSHVPKLVQNIVIDEPTPFDKLLPRPKDLPEKKLVMPGEAPSKKKIQLIHEIN